MNTTKRAKLTTHCFNYVNEYLFKELRKIDVDFSQTIHDIAMMLEGYVLMNAENKFIPKAMKDIQRDIEMYIEFHNEYDKQSHETH